MQYTSLPSLNKALHQNEHEPDESAATLFNKSKPKLYALLVGIADYLSEIRLADDRVRFPKLSGCVSDAQKVKDYLEQDDYYETDIMLLTNEKGSKAEIARLFIEHLGKAGERDTVLFYFSGHGTQEHTDKKVFSSETDGKLESVVCYYSEDTKADFLLSDKELRWLINQVSSKGPHIVTIFDCCHSAGITRNSALVTTVFRHVVEKRIPFVFPAREWKNFIFSPTISIEDMVTTGEFRALPEGRHIQFSACESNEAAVEVAGEGVFTKTLLKVLKSTGGQVSYQTLNNRVRQYLRSVYEQKPRIYLANAEQDSMFSTFLNKPFHGAGALLGEVTYNQKTGWQLNAGAIHGMNKSVSEIMVIDPNNPGQSVTARTGIIGADYTQLFMADAVLNEDEVYKANLTGLLSGMLRVFIAPGYASPEDRIKLLDAVTENARDYIEPADEKDAEYVLRFEQGNYFITLPYDMYRPLTKVVKAGSVNWINNILMLFRHISNWAFLKNLSNEDNQTALSGNVIRVNVSTGIPLGPPVTVDFNHPDVVIHYAVQGKQLRSKIKIQITNTAACDMYCCPVYLTSNFQSFTGYLNPDVYHLEPGESVTLNLEGTEELDIVSSEMMKRYNWEKFTDYLKFIVSTEDFDAAALTLDPLPEPVSPASRSSRETDTAKGIITALPDRKTIKGWRTYDLTVTLINPDYNRISRKELQSMLGDENTSYFASGLYYTASAEGNCSAGCNIKPEIKMPDESGNS